MSAIETDEQETFMNKKGIGLIALTLAIGIPGPVRADAISDLKANMEALQKQLDAVKAQLDAVSGQVKSQQQVQAEEKKTLGVAAPFLQLKPGDALTVQTIGGGEVTLYGNLDVSLDSTTKGLQSSYDQGGSPVGRVGWQPAISTNLSYIGVKGSHPLPSDGLKFVWQLEGGIDISATPGTKSTNSNTSDSVNGALFSRNSFIGFTGKEWGSALIGKSETPYKTSTDKLNPFSGTLGDYRVIMGNTGGDNRVEFALRAAHAIWYESPNFGGVSFKAMYSPGQNRSDDNSNLPAAEQDCAGGNVPGSGALTPTCNDGSFGNLYSTSVAYEYGPLYLTAAYELHKKVNRTSDLGDLDPRDVGDELAYKIGGQYKFPTKTTLNLLWERTKRRITSDLEFQNERSRANATWVAVTQEVTGKDSVSLGWAHAGRTPGDPGQHNTPGGSGPDNAANLYSLIWKHSFDSHLIAYVDGAMTVNHAAAHYDLGAGGHSVTTDCHDASDLAAFDATTGGVTGDGPHCFAGGRLKGASVGLAYRF
jgi:predicted porin